MKSKREPRRDPFTFRNFTKREMACDNRCKFKEHDPANGSHKVIVLRLMRAVSRQGRVGHTKGNGNPTVFEQSGGPSK